MRVMTDFTPTKDTECLFRVDGQFCDIHGDLRYCVPKLKGQDPECPYCIGLSDYRMELLSQIAIRRKAKEDDYDT